MLVHLNIPNAESYPNIHRLRTYWNPLTVAGSLFPITYYPPPKKKTYLKPIAYTEPIGPNTRENVFNQDHTGPSLGVEHLTIYTSTARI
jgi:hypothetical protein